MAGKEKINGVNDEIDSRSQLKGYGVRHQQCLILFFCLTTAYSMRSCIGVAMVAMVDSPKVAIALLNETNNFNYSDIRNQTYLSDAEDYKANNSVATIINDVDNVTHVEEFKTNGFFNAMLFTRPYPKFQWTKKQQDMIVASFQWGYMLLQIPGGMLAHRFGARFLLTGALSINFLFSFCMPWACYYGGWILAVMCRIVQGLSQACIVPGLHTFFGKWAPLEERARLAGFALGGQALGTVLGLPITGFLASSALGWPGIFRFYGVLSGLIALMLYFLLFDTPADHPKISVTERRYIEEGLGEKEGDSKRHLPVPWCQILRCRGLYAIAIAHIGQTWGQLTLYTQVPNFMANVMGVNIRANGVLTALPFLVMWFTNFLWSWLTDWVIIKKYLSVTNARKMANSIGCVPAALGLVVLAYVPKDIYVVESLLIIICAFKISAHVGFQVNHIDISPNFAGTMMSISNFVSNLFASVAPIVAGFILTDPSSEYLWRYVFFVSAGLYFFTNLIYVILGTGEKADWNDPQSNDLQSKNLEEQIPMIHKNQSKIKT